jgi:hypothetical protein
MPPGLPSRPYVLLDNHDHLLLPSPQANLSGKWVMKRCDPKTFNFAYCIGMVGFDCRFESF